MIQPFFDYASNTWYTNLNKNLKTRLRAAKNKCIRFYVKLGDRTSITVKEFEKITGCQFTKRSINAYYLVYINFMQKAPDYMDEISSHAERNRIPTRYSYPKLKLPHRKANQGLRA